MPTLEQLSPLLLEDFKTIRLRALEDTPAAFSSTYAKESQLSAEGWRKRVATWNSDTAACYIAMDEAEPCGIIAGYLDKNNPLRANVASMWVAPTHRRTGLGTMLIDAVQLWARKCGARELRLMVTGGNDAAIGFYERCGFTFTGMTGPYENDPAVFEQEMAKHLVS